MIVNYGYVNVLYEGKKRCVHYTSVCLMISIGMFMLTASALLLSVKQT